MKNVIFQRRITLAAMVASLLTNVLALPKVAMSAILQADAAHQQVLAQAADSASKGLDVLPMDRSLVTSTIRLIITDFLISAINATVPKDMDALLKIMDSQNVARHYLLGIM